MAGAPAEGSSGQDGWPALGGLWGSPRVGGVGIGLAGHVTIHQGPAQAANRSAYLQQVRRIAPPDPPGLLGRDAELAELARFCLEPTQDSYIWWRAEAWAGKSALLSTFVLRPPPQVAERVRMVSFFITARLASQDTREAFTQVLLEQLAEVIGQALPAVLPETTREGYLLDLLAQAAAACQQAGQRLVLVVDGLDEDCGVTGGPHAHSIAGLLPAEPPSGMRVIVAGRPNPPIPDDVPGWHPLRDPGIVRLLADSPYARDMQRLGRHELQQLLSGPAAGRDLLGLLTAARGGLSGADLEELTGVPSWEIEKILHAVAGRTFTRRVSHWAPGTGPEMYLLGHEELQVAAVRYLASRLPGYRNRLNLWANSYRDKGWPPGTPEYLLSGYYRLLAAHGDLAGMITCATDSARHDRMLDLTGGDAEALAEIRIALDFIADQDAPDLKSALALVCRRDRLTDRNSIIPLGLLAVWGALGHITRAEALARSITDPCQQVMALAQLVRALDGSGQHEHAVRLTAQAETVAASITDQYQQVMALAQLVRALDGSGQHEHAVRLTAQAETVARSITNQCQQVMALAQLVRALDGSGQHDHVARLTAQAETLSRVSIDSSDHAQALAAVAGALARAGQSRQAETLARSITGVFLQVDALAQVAGALAEAGQHEHAARLAAQAEATPRTIAAPFLQGQALTLAAEALARAGQHHQAETLARSITDSYWQAYALAQVVGALAEAGQHHQAETLAHSITSPYKKADALADVARALVSSGQHQQAAELAGHAETAAHFIVTDPYRRAITIARVARALAEAGQHEQALGLAARAETAARTITYPSYLAEALAQVARALAKAGQQEHAARLAVQAETAACAIPDLVRQAQALSDVARALAEAGQYQQAETLARSISHQSLQAEAIAQVAKALADGGQRQEAARLAIQAEALAHSIASPSRKAQAMVLAAGALAGAGQDEQAVSLAAQAETAARTIVNPFRQAKALALVAEALAEAGQHQQAEVLARSVTDPSQQAQALALVAEALTAAGDTRSATRVAADTCRLGQLTTAARPVLLLDPSAFTVLVHMLDYL